MFLDFLIAIGGIAVLVGGGELLVRGAASLARSLGISAMIVGLTVVAFGTSAPEFVVGVMAAVKGNVSICGGNVVGSNIMNILLVLGGTALVCPIQSTSAFVRREVPIMIGVSLLFGLLVVNQVLTRWEGLILLVVLVTYTFATIRIASREKATVVAEYAASQPTGSMSIPLNVVFIVVGIAMLGGGARMFLFGAVNIAEALGVSEAIIGLTLVAIGTSFPELVSSLVAASRKQPDICMGNIVGSCICNLLWIGGTCGVIRDLPFDNKQDHMLHVHIPVMIFAAVILWPIIATKHRISRLEGGFLLVLYGAYLFWTIHLGT